MQRNQARKEVNQKAIITGWPTDAQEYDRDGIIDWLLGVAGLIEICINYSRFLDRTLGFDGILKFRQ